MKAKIKTNKVISLSGIIMLVILLFLILNYTYSQTNEQYKHYIELKIFIDSKMTSTNGGIYTNYLDKENEGDLTRGHEILSESVGLQLLIYYYENNEELFEEKYKYLKEYFIQKDNSIRWRVDEDIELSKSVNASIDDLRIVKALLLASELWENEEYKEMAYDIGNSLLNHSTWQNYMLNQKNGEFDVEISYQDTKTMFLLGRKIPKWLEIRRRSLTLVEQSYIEDEFPFYHKLYMIENGNYVKYDTLNMIDCMMVVLHLSEENRVKEETIDWLKTKLENGKIYDQYRYGDWKAMSNEESTAIYALIARVANNIGDIELYDLAIEKMEKFQVKKSDSEIYGAFGTDESLEVFSFDLLQGVMAYLEG